MDQKPEMFHHAPQPKKSLRIVDRDRFNYSTVSLKPEHMSVEWT